MSSQDSKFLVRKASPEDFEPVYALLRGFHNYALQKEDWQRLFEKHWEGGEDYCGYVLVVNGEVVGFLGAIFSQRTMLGVEQKFCNLSSWIVKEGHRNKGLYLLFPILNLKDRIITNFTASKDIQTIFRDLGFTELGSDIRIIPPVPNLLASFSRQDCQVIFNQEAIKNHLGGEELSIHQDHARFKCKHFFIKSPSGDCYVIATRISRKKIPLAYIHFLSNSEAFIRCINRLALKIFFHLKVAAAFIEERLLGGGQIPFSIKYRLPQYKFYRAPAGNPITPEQIDNLYSEIIILNLWGA